MTENPRILTIILLMLGVTVLSAVDSVIVRLLTESLHPFVIVFFRSLFGLICVAPWIFRDRTTLISHYRVLHFIRAGLKMLSLAAFFTAIALAALADVTAIAFTTPMFVTVGAWIFLREAVLFKRAVAVMLCFVGVLVIVQPGASAWSGSLIYAVIGALLAAIIQLMLKKMSARDSTDTLVAWNLIATVPMAAIPLFWLWQVPTTGELGLLALQGAIGACNMTLMTRALSLAQASFVAPLDFLRLPAVALLGFLFFNEIPTNATVIGSVVIFLSTMLLADWSRKAAASRFDSG